MPDERRRTVPDGRGPQYHILDTTANGNSPIPHLSEVTTPLLFLPICGRTPLPGELHVSMMLD
jgi:hypothetical protein